jgi:exopolysaccharide biosynthesis polyprenyl glycosylphosphotransferase
MSTVTHPTYRALERPHEHVVGGVRLRVSPRAVWTAASIAVDATMLAAAVLVAELGSRSAGVSPAPAGWQVAFALLVLTICAVRGMYAWRMTLQLLDDLRTVVTATALAAMAVVAVDAVATGGSALAPPTIRLWAFAAVYLSAGRIALNWWQAQSRRHGELVKPTLIVGAGTVGHLTAKRLLEQPERGLLPIGFLDKEPLESDGILPVLGASWDLDRIVDEYGVQEVVVTFSTAPNEVLLRLARRCEQLGVEVVFVPRLFERMTERLAVEHLGGLPLVAAYAPDPKGWQFAVKYTLDRLLAAIALVLLSPLMLGAALAVRLSVGRPLLFRQLRVGRDGRPFEILKYRSMKADDAAPSEPLPEVSAHQGPGGVEGADRRTAVGTFLRCTSIDELPQLLNVLKGEMSLVGPRPERPEFVELFEEHVHRYGDRHRVKSGITGWAQVHGLRGKTSIADRAEWDNYYIENWSLWLDFKILLLTVVAVLRCFKQVE